MTEPSCSSCRFWFNPNESELPADIRSCRRHPPHRKHGFLQTQAETWCGEYEPNEQRKQEHRDLNVAAWDLKHHQSSETSPKGNS